MTDTPNPPSGEPTPEQQPPQVPPATPPETTPVVTPESATPLDAMTPDPADVEKNKVFALLSYIGILWLVPLLAAKDSPFAKFHANQGIILTIIGVCTAIVIGIFGFIINFVPFIGCFVSCALHLAFLIGIVSLMIMGIVNASNGRMKKLPVIGSMFTILK